MLNPAHELLQLAAKLDWDRFEAAFAGGYSPGVDGPIEFLLPTSVLVFGAGWAASTLMTSPVGAWGIASGAPFAVGGVLVSGHFLLGTPTEEQFKGVYTVACYALGAAGLFVSSVVYVRGVEP